MKPDVIRPDVGGKAEDCLRRNLAVSHRATSRQVDLVRRWARLVHARAVPTARLCVYTFGVPPMIAHLSAAAAILAMLCALLLGVIPILAKEPPQSRALKSWLDIWLPLLLALPVAVAPLLPGATRLSSPLLLSLMDLAPIACVCLITGAALIDHRCQPVRCIDGHHVVALIAIAIVLVLASFTGRLMDWSGHLLITAAMLWLWTVSSEPGPAAQQSGGNGDPVFLVDWTGPLKHTLGGLTQSLLVLSPVLLLAAVLGRLVLGGEGTGRWGGEALNAMLTVLILVPLGQGLALLALWILVRPAAVLRCAVSTVILTVLFGLGVLCARLIPWLYLVGSVREGVDPSYEITDLTGLTVLLMPALLIFCMAAFGLIQWCSRRTLLAMGCGLIAASIILLTLSLSQVRSHWPQPKPESSPQTEPADPAGRGDSSPQSNTGTFLQDSSI